MATECCGVRCGVEMAGSEVSRFAVAKQEAPSSGSLKCALAHRTWQSHGARLCLDTSAARVHALEGSLSTKV